MYDTPPFKKIKQDTMKSIVLFFSSFNSGKFGSLLVASTTIMMKAQMQLLFLSLLILIDFFTGVRRNFIDKEIKPNPFKKTFWSTINSKGMRETWNKAYQYGFGIIILIAVQALFFGESSFEILSAQFSVAKAGILVLCGIEIYSIFENIKPNGYLALTTKMEDWWMRVYSVLFKGQRKDD